MSSAVNNLATIRVRVEKAACRANRDAADIRIVAVAKNVDPGHMLTLYQSGHRLFGESYSQELLKKREWLTHHGAEDIEFHFVGRLQRNKVKSVVGSCALIHSVDRIELAQEIDRVSERCGIVQPVLIQVNVSEERSKGGLSRAQCLDDLASILELRSLRVRGLMAIGSPMVKDAVEEFMGLEELRRGLEARYEISLPELSIGMSGDFEEAIGCGATFIRLGTAIFGEREAAVSGT